MYIKIIWFLVPHLHLSPSKILKITWEVGFILIRSITWWENMHFARKTPVLLPCNISSRWLWSYFTMDFLWNKRISRCPSASVIGVYSTCFWYLSMAVSVGHMLLVCLLVALILGISVGHISSFHLFLPPFVQTQKCFQALLFFCVNSICNNSETFPKHQHNSLVGVFLPPIWKVYSSNWIEFPPNFEVNIKKQSLIRTTYQLLHSDLWLPEMEVTNKPWKGHGYESKRGHDLKKPGSFR